MALLAVGRPSSSMSFSWARPCCCAGVRAPGNESGSRALGTADDPQLAAAAAAAEEVVTAVRLEARHADARRHLDLLQDFTALRVDLPQLTLVAFPRRVPELAVRPRDARDESIGLDGAQNRPGRRIDLMDLAGAILSDPERPFGPCQPRVAARAGRRNGGQYSAGLRVDFLDAALGDLKEVAAVKGRSRMCGDID